MKRVIGVLLALPLAVLALPACSRGAVPIRVGAIYPLSGSQGPGGIDEYRGVRLAADLVNRDGGVGHRPIEIVPVDAPGSDAAQAAVQTLSERGIRFVLGTYGSTISSPAAQAASRAGMLFWETGAVGMMLSPDQGRLIFRVAPTGSVLGRSAIAFIARELAPKLHREARSLRFAVANVDDDYGSAVARGAMDEIRALGLRSAGEFTYDPNAYDAAEVIRRIARARPDVLFVSAYLKDGVALWHQAVRQHLPLVAAIGTSSSFCMPAFGSALGEDALGLFASDKPNAVSLNASGLSPDAARLLARANAAYRAAYGEPMSAPALAGFSAAWALFHDVMPRAASVTPLGVAAAARAVKLPKGSLPNGSGLEFGEPGTPDAGANLAAVSVIWEWVGVNWEAVVWPPALATYPVEPLPLAS